MDLDDLNEEVDCRVIEGHARMIDPLALVLALDVRLRLAVNTTVRNLAAREEVWCNPRWPTTQAADYQRAKDVLTPKLFVHGLLPPV
jgi:hypothetical protein